MADQDKAPENKSNPGSAGYGMDAEIQSSYDADGFLYNEVPYGEFPEALAALQNKPDKNTNKQK